MATARTHQKCLRRAKVRRANGLPSHRIEKKIKLDTAWRNIFIRSGYLKA
ncbi:DUF3983 domain-containing protein [Priestia megaterium]|nr:DUF3983 domain-containing protein [Priestia megaterium]